LQSISETILPGVGTRFEFTTTGGLPVGVVVRRDGGRDVLIYDRADPDRCQAVIHLGPADATTLIDLLGGSAVVARHQEVLRQSLEGIDLEWIAIPESSPAAGNTIAEISMRRNTGASIVSILRGDAWTTSPPSDFRIESGDTVVVVGAPDAIAQARASLVDA
jgi:TrkA domain protein